MIINTSHYIIMGILNFVKTENKDKQISPCYQIITGWLNVHTYSGKNLAIHVGYTIKLKLFKYVEQFCLYYVLCRTMYNVACIVAD